MLKASYKLWIYISLTALLLSSCAKVSVGIETPLSTSEDPSLEAGIETSTPEPASAQAATVTPEPTLPMPSDPTAGLVFNTAEGLWQIDASGKPQLLVDQSTARLSPDGKYAVYARDDEGEGGNDIWLVDLTSGEQRNLTHTPDLFEVGPEWWPGRPDVVVFGTGNEPGMGNSDLPTLVNQDGSGYLLLDPAEGGPRAYSPNGEKFAYNDYDNIGKIYRWGGSPEVFDPAQYGVSAKSLTFLAWSPDSRYLTAKVSGDLAQGGGTSLGFAIFDLETKTSQLLHIYTPAGGGMFPDYLSWSPDGQWLAFVTYNEPPGGGRQPNLWVSHPDGTDEKFVAAGLNPMWSPDSRHLAFLNTGSDNRQHLWLAETGTWEPQELMLPVDSMVNFLTGWYTR